MTRVERVAARRRELLKDLNKQFMVFCEQEGEGVAGPRYPYDVKPGQIVSFRRHEGKVIEYIYDLVSKKPQEKSFYISVFMEWQRQIIEQLKEVKDEEASKENL